MMNLDDFLNRPVGQDILRRFRITDYTRGEPPIQYPGKLLVGAEEILTHYEGTGLAAEEITEACAAYDKAVVALGDTTTVGEFQRLFAPVRDMFHTLSHELEQGFESTYGTSYVFSRDDERYHSKDLWERQQERERESYRMVTAVTIAAYDTIGGTLQELEAQRETLQHRALGWPRTGAAKCCSPARPGDAVAGAE